MSARVAIYAAPGSLPADAVGARLLEQAEWWIGRSAAGNPVAPAAPAGWSRADVDAITIDARRYGFHATLKAPFRLAEGRTLADLEQAVERFAAAHSVVEVPNLALTRLGAFFAIMPGAPAEPLYSLAAEVVTEFDEFRAPASDQEIARRNPAGMTERRRELFERWGYPYVLDEFRLHFTLTDPIEPERRDEVEAVLAEWFRSSLGRTLPIDCLAIYTECEPGAPFELHAVYPLGSASAPESSATARGSQNAEPATQGTR
ncbi:DUF1045 domain-containing protein [Gryllotalpicola reticulitermitis]|uniref:DUF1045 domain-containing protein n=1 Tax=Gryllotalpicola reticulitermitis TaxID=1184153 RepID=A0ABV8Q7F4_9MICO